MAYGILLSMEKTTVYLSEEIQRGLGALARKTGRPKAELIREALERYIEAEDDFVLPSWVGAAKGGPVTDSSTIKQEARAAWYGHLKKKYGWED